MNDQNNTVEIDTKEFSLKELQEVLDKFFLEEGVRPTQIKIPKNERGEQEFLDYCKSMNIQVIYND